MRVVLVLCGIVVGIAALAFFITPNLPARQVSWESPDSGIVAGFERVKSFFERLVGPSSLSVVVFGYPGSGFGSSVLADAIILIHYKPQTNIAYLVSIPRDLWISDSHEQFKINEAIHKKKISAALDTIRQMTGVAADDYISVNLTAVQRAVDALGGVDIVLDEPAVDWVSNFTMNAGPQHLDGEYAVWLIRNRYNTGGDFWREKNQQKVVAAAFEKFKTLSSSEKLSFIKQFAFESDTLGATRLDLSRIIPLAAGATMGTARLAHIVLDPSTKLLKTSSVPFIVGSSTTYASVVLPAAGFEQYGEIRAYIQQRMGSR